MSMFILQKSWNTFIWKWIISVCLGLLSSFTYANEALLKAVKANNTSEVLSLLQVNKHLNMEIQDLDGQGVLHFAILHGNLEILEALLMHGANINQLDHLKVTPFQWALQIRDCNIHMIELLLKYHANVNQRGMAGITSLHWAVRSGQWQAVKLLLDYKGRIWALDQQGRSAFQWALEDKDLNMIGFFCWFFAAKVSEKFSNTFFESIHDKHELLKMQRGFINMHNCFINFANNKLSIFFDAIWPIIQNQKNLKWEGDFRVYVLNIFNVILGMIQSRIDQLNAEEEAWLAAVIVQELGNETHTAPLQAGSASHFLGARGLSL